MPRQGYSIWGSFFCCCADRIRWILGAGLPIAVVLFVVFAYIYLEHPRIIPRDTNKLAVYLAATNQQQ